MPVLTTYVPTAVGLYLFLLGPGHAWWSGRTSAVSRLLARIALSATWTSLAGLTLAAAGAFSIPKLVLVNALVTLGGYTLIGRAREEGMRAARGSGAAVVVVVLALWVYWPPYEIHFGASDASSYAAAGIQLARRGALSKSDSLVVELSPMEQHAFFPSAFGRPWLPPYNRMPGGMVIDTPGDPEVHPSFFPVPSVWAAIFAELVGSRYVGGYAGLFTALALAACWLVLRRRVGRVTAAGACVVLALNAAVYWFGRFALSEPLAWFFLWIGLAALDAWEDEGLAADAALAGVALAATCMVRLELTAFLALALAARRVLRPSLGTRPLAPAFTVAGGVVLVAAVLLELVALSGVYLAPVANTLAGLQYGLATDWLKHPLGVILPGAAVVVAAAATTQRMGWRRGAPTVLLAGGVAVYCGLVSQPHALRSGVWLSSYLGWPLLAAAAFGAWTAWSQRMARPADGFLLVVTVSIGGLLIYDPHVLVSMPWAMRRFLPLVVPALVVWAAVCVERIAWRSRVLAAVVGVAIAVVALRPARAFWGVPFYAGAQRQLAEFNELLPEHSVSLIDAQLDSLVLATPLWLLYGRESLSATMFFPQQRRFLSGFVHKRAAQWPLVLVASTAALEEHGKLPFVRMDRIADYTFSLLLPQIAANHVPTFAYTFTVPVSIFRLSPMRHLPPPPRKRGPVSPAPHRRHPSFPSSPHDRTPAAGAAGSVGH